MACAPDVRPRRPTSKCWPLTTTRSRRCRPRRIREAYLRLHADYLRYLSVVPAGFGLTQPTQLHGESCESLRAHTRDSRRAHDLAVNGLVSGEDKDWRAIEARRQAALSDLSWYDDRARMLGCATPSGTSAMADQGQPAGPRAQTPDLQPAGHVQPFGGYLAPPRGSTVGPLPDGGVFVYGNSMATSEWRSQRGQSDALRRRSGTSSAPDAGPKFYDAQRHGWRRLPPALECKAGAPQPAHRHGAARRASADRRRLVRRAQDGRRPRAALRAVAVGPGLTPVEAGAGLAQARIFHSASLMPDGRVLLAGGENDPALSSGEVVPASVERYAKGELPCRRWARPAPSTPPRRCPTAACSWPRL
jgi:hypothetical protein